MKVLKQKAKNFAKKILQRQKISQKNFSK